jgi:Domain of unknown function (DUF1902)
MMRLFADYDPKAEVWVGKVDGLPIHTEAATLDDLVAKVWAKMRELTDDRVEEFELTARVGAREGSLLEHFHV